jgi:hypothetical protein
MEAEFSMDLKIQKSNWNQFERHYKGYYRIAIGNVEDTIVTYCRADKRMASIETNKDLVGLLLVLRSVCVQNYGAIKVNQEYQNLSTLHLAVAYRQKKNVNDTKFADEVADRYESALFTSGRFTICGASAHEFVLKTYPPSPLTFIEYLQLQKEDQTPIDALVKERTVARLIVKSSLNDRLRDHLITAFSTGDDCYPNTISDALSLLSTFVKAKKDTTAEDAVVSYHEVAHEVDIADDNEDTCAVSDTEANDMNDVVYDCVKEDDIESDADEHGNHVQFSASVMAMVIAEATADAEEDQFIGASFAQLQDVEDVYEDDEPDIV